ncbi:hypothetical protein MTS1_00343 [Microbacterium sp. TS-1]|nr:hypothetical protein MTS1_00343 [Microbacterium sp. TS-1]
MLGFSSSGLTVMWSFTRVGLSVSTVLVTMPVVLLYPAAHTRVRSVVWVRGAVVGATGFEPAASRSQSGRSTKLSYAPGAQHTCVGKRPWSV